MWLAIGGARTGGESHILHATSRRHAFTGEMGLSIKTFLGGRALYDTGTGRFAVEEDRYLLLNESEPYTVTIESRKPVESFCVFFAKGLPAEAWRSRSADARVLLDTPELAGPPPVFVQRTHPLEGRVRSSLARLRRRVLSGDGTEAVEEALYALLEKLVFVERRVETESRALSSLKATTRHELLRRLYRAREFMAASLAEPLSLSELASVACLSPSHFLRTFRELFGSTPHAYLTALRVGKAKGLLEGPDSVTEICSQVGFESLGSFSLLFKREVGCSPAAFRKLIISDKTRGAREP